VTPTRKIPKPQPFHFYFFFFIFCWVNRDELFIPSCVTRRIGARREILRGKQASKHVLSLPLSLFLFSSFLSSLKEKKSSSHVADKIKREGGQKENTRKEKARK